MLADSKSNDALEQPTIELLATDVFGFAQTGTRVPLNVNASFRGSPEPTFQSGITVSHWFGQVLYATQPGWVYLDELQDGLSFMGADNTVESFTMGYYYSSIPNFHALIWTVLNTHNFSPSSDLWYEVSHWRMSPNFRPDTFIIFNVWPNNTFATIGSFAQTGAEQSVFNHYAFVYDKDAGQFMMYFNGGIKTSISLPNLQVSGSQGGYETIITS